ncbi:hypothetical protein KC319_g34 [Hortaea werneckii]|nr:hypothetical protein KC319_g34 [Hortaea werneckii]
MSNLPTIGSRTNRVNSFAFGGEVQRASPQPDRSRNTLAYTLGRRRRVLLSPVTPRHELLELPGNFDAVRRAFGKAFDASYDFCRKRAITASGRQPNDEERTERPVAHRAHATVEGWQ